MKIVDHRLVRDDGTPYPFVKSPNVSAGTLKATYLVMHYTAGSSAKESIGWLADPRAKASAHVVIGRDGQITQLVPFNRVAWHAGQSRWRGTVGLNSHSIGIELDNAGKLAKRGGAWVAAFGKAIPPEQVLEATHKNESSPAGWQRYTPEQMDAARELAALLIRTYGLKEVIGHDDISPGRKQDPGPAFPFDDFRRAVMGGGAEPKPEPKPAPSAGGWFATTAKLNIRTGAGTANPTVPGGPLPQGTLVQALEDGDAWKRVAAAGEVNGVSGVVGWVGEAYLAPVTGPAFTVSADALNVRSGPGPSHPAVDGSPLPRGTVVQELSAESGWKRVAVHGAPHGARAVVGWVSERYLSPAVIPVAGVAGAGTGG
jgi:N-acetylmuramoyl-L-alanine amidase